jgi:Protein of unknown function (DUF3108)
MLRKVLQTVVALCLLAAFSLADDTPANLLSANLPSKESLTYDVEWRLINAGKAHLTWTQRPGEIKGYEIKLHLESLGLVSRLFRVNDDYTATLNPDLCAVSTFMTAHEGNRNRESRVAYGPRKATYLERDLNKNAQVLSKEVDIPACVHDLIGGLYFLREQDVEPGHSIQLPVSNGKRTASLKVDALRRETLKVGGTEYKTVQYEVNAFNNVMYARPGHMSVWLTDDKRRLLVQLQIRLQFTVGTITFRLNRAE